MKYILARELPFAKKGKNLFTNPDGEVFIDCELSKNLSGLYLGQAKTLLTEGWIEEVKPREWWEITDNKRNYTGTRYISFNEASCIFNRLDCNPNIWKIIKVQEVVE